MSKYIDLTGKTFTRLTVIKLDRIERKKVYWICKCICGTKKIIRTDTLLKETTRSCGCLQKELTKIRFDKYRYKHGKKYSKIYKIWEGMKQRCKNKKNTAYANYGGRGITLDPRWEKFENFYEDMGDPGKEQMLERINNNKGYYKENCKWATRVEQNNNKRSNRLITFNGKTQNITQWATEIGIYENTIQSRLRLGWSLERALTQKVRKMKNNFRYE